MPQAALPDLNTAYIIYRREVLNTIKSRNYTAMAGSLFAINALLPEDYQVEVSDRKYYEKTSQDLLVVCSQCKEEFKRTDIIIKEVLAPYLLSTIIGTKREKLWECTKCHKDNILYKTKMIQNLLKEPYFLKIVPNPPQRTNNLQDRTEFHRKIEKWAYRFLDELEHQMSLFRLEYKPKDEGITDDVGDGGENLDI